MIIVILEKKQNKLFINNEKMFYRHLNQQTSNIHQKSIESVKSLPTVKVQKIIGQVFGVTELNIIKMQNGDIVL